MDEGDIRECRDAGNVFVEWHRWWHTDQRKVEMEKINVRVKGTGSRHIKSLVRSILRPGLKSH